MLEIKKRSYNEGMVKAMTSNESDSEIERLNTENNLLRKTARNLIKSAVGIESDEELDGLINQIQAEINYEKKSEVLRSGEEI
jgi:hypothetical protein